MITMGIPRENYFPTSHRVVDARSLNYHAESLVRWLPSVSFEIIGKIVATEIIAKGYGIRERIRLVKQYGKGNWKKKKDLRPLR